MANRVLGPGAKGDPNGGSGAAKATKPAPTASVNVPPASSGSTSSPSDNRPKEGDK